MSGAGVPPSLWLGGAPGAGKSTIAWRLAHAYDLPLHPIDLWTYEHAARQAPRAPVEAELARGPEAAADAFEAASAARLSLVWEDVRRRCLGPVPALVEGPQLLPALAGAAALPAGFGVWLVPDPAQTRRARRARAEAARDPALRARTEGLVARDAVLAGRVRETAGRAGRPVIDVGAAPDWPSVYAAVEAALAPALAVAPRLAAGRALAAARRYENLAACRQGRLWQAAARLAALPPYAFACECGASGCAAVWPALPDAYDARTERGPLQVHGPGAARAPAADGR